MKVKTTVKYSIVMLLIEENIKSIGHILQKNLEISLNFDDFSIRKQ